MSTDRDRETAGREAKRPARVDGQYSIRELVDVEQLRHIFEKFSRASGFTTGFISFPDQELLIGTGWRDICTKFHRAFPASEAVCKESNVALTERLRALESLNVRRCAHGLVDGATPVIVRGVHVASLATGQVLFEKPDRERFRRQAETFGYDVDAYLAALDQVPVVTEEQLTNALDFLSDVAVMIAEEALARLEALEMAGALERDIARRERAEEALRRSEARYRLIAENATDVIWTTDLALQMTYVSPSVLAQRGFTVEETLAQSAVEMMTPDSARAATRTLRRLAEEAGDEAGGGNGTTTVDLELRCKDDSTIWGQTTVSLIRDVAGKPAGILGVSRDVTAQKQAEAERATLEEQLRQSQKMEAIGRLAGGVAHDFNNILTGIQGYAELSLAALDPDDPVHGHVEVIRRASERAASLTSQLLTFSRKQVVSPRVVCVNEVIAEAKQMIRRLIREDIELVVVPSFGAWSVRIDPMQLDQVLMNLAVNARDAMPEGGQLTIQTANVSLASSVAHLAGQALAGDVVMLSVSDTGTGMDQETKAQAF